MAVEVTISRVSCVTSAGIRFPFADLRMPYPCSIGKAAVKALLTPAFKKVKNAPKVEIEEDAVALLLKVLPQ